jgi:hypothetical protein
MSTRRIIEVTDPRSHPWSVTNLLIRPQGVNSADVNTGVEVKGQVPLGSEGSSSRVCFILKPEVAQELASALMEVARDCLHGPVMDPEDAGHWEDPST